MNESNEDLDQLSKEVRQIADEIAAMKAKVNTMVDGSERIRLKQEIKQMQWQALFYCDKTKNLAKAKRKEGL